MVITGTFPCGICHKKIPARGKLVFCNHCSLWVHVRSNNISNSDHEEQQKEPDNVPWFFLKSTTVIFPFGSLDTEELPKLNEFDFPSFLDSMPSFEITSGLTNLTNLEDYNIDEHLPSNVNSSYHIPLELSTLDTSTNDLLLFHTNIRSLSLYFDDLLSTLSNLKIKYDVIGVSETWNSSDISTKANVEIPGYSYLPFQSHTQNGGIAFYMK